MDEMFFVVISKAGCLITSFLETPRMHILLELILYIDGYNIITIVLSAEVVKSQEFTAYTNSI